MNIVRHTVVILISAITPAIAEAFVDFDWATVGNPGNASELVVATRLGLADAFVGGVEYTYAISKTEVTNAQYVEFLNAIDRDGLNLLGLYSPEMAGDFGGIVNSGGLVGSHYRVKAGRGEHPVNFVSWWDAARFINWMHNGQGSSGTEQGAYSLPEGEPKSDNYRVLRQVDAKYWLPNESEWHKAAYHDASSGVVGGYFSYANTSNVAPLSARPETTPTGANYYNYDGVIDGVNDGYAAIGRTGFQAADVLLTDVGAYFENTSSYGTYDQNGNVAEWTEGRFSGSSTYRIVRGGNWWSTIDGIPNPLLDYYRLIATHESESAGIGFRVATVPEASAAVIASVAILVFHGVVSHRFRM